LPPPENGDDTSTETSVDFQRTTRRYIQQIKLIITTAARTSNPTPIKIKLAKLENKTKTKKPVRPYTTDECHNVRHATVIIS
jgi:NADPH-dependent ferric siderophore reductase